MKDILELVLEDEEIQSFVRDRELFYLQTELGYTLTDNDSDKNSKILRIEYLLLTKLLKNDSKFGDEGHRLQDIAYSLLKSYDIYDSAIANLFNQIMGVDNLNVVNLYHFYLASLALRSEKTVKIRLDLQSYAVPYDKNDLDWKQLILNRIFEAFILLVRKQNGYQDIKESLLIISSLKESQAEYEESYLKQFKDSSREIENAQFILGLYHLSKTITETADYLIKGYNYQNTLNSQIRVHSEVAKEIFKNTPRLQDIVEILEFNLVTLQRNSIWFSTESIQIKKLRDFCILKSQAEKSMVELLPSQRNALNNNLLDIAANVTVVEMPTSAGKTLLAEFNIIVTKALNSESKIVYIVPSRALVNQVYQDLKSDFEGLNFVIEKTSGAIEVDPAENDMLQEEIDVLVSTPEKLDLLIRRKHSSVANVALFVIDEAHMIQNGSRGAKLELLLAILKRERPSSKFMFLSPFLKGSADTIADWIGGNKIKSPIKINWRPSEKLLIGIKQKQNFKQFTQTLIPSAYSLINAKQEMDSVKLDYLSEGGPREKYIQFAAKRYGADNKSILYLCAGSGTVDKRARYLATNTPVEIGSEKIDLVRKYILDEVGKETILSSVLSKRIAVHHAGLSDETKLLVEHLIREKEIKHIFATSTLAEGVNFPVSAVYFDTYRKGDTDLTVSDFWNIAGRAGRTLVDNYGKLIFPFDSKGNEAKAMSLIAQSSSNIISVLLEFMIDADKIIEQLLLPGAGSIFKFANQYEDSLGPLIQYLVHLLNITGNESANVIEDMFKDSLGYFQLKSPEDKQKFIDVCKTIYANLHNTFKKGTLVFADKTGFSVPSVLEIMKTENKKNPSVSSSESWLPENLFDRGNDFLTEKIKIIAKLKETKLGTESQASPLNESAIAKILIGWVKGEQLFEISSYHPHFSSIGNDSERINLFVKYINSARFKASWGLGALEGIVTSKNEELVENSYVPSMVYYGVDTEKALKMRMAGVPRRLAKSLSSIFSDDHKMSISQIRKRIKDLGNSDWDSLSPVGSALTGQEWKRVSEILIK